MKKKTRNTWSIVALVFFVLLVFGGIFYATQQTALSNIQIIAQPTFGKLECAPDTDPLRQSTRYDVEDNSQTIPATRFGDVASAQITLLIPAQGQFSDQDRIRYSICLQSNPNTCIQKDTVEIYASNRNEVALTLKPINREYQYEIHYEDYNSPCLSTVSPSCWQRQPLSDGQLKYTAVYTPYVLYREDIQQGRDQISQTCANPVSDAGNEGLEIVTSTSLAAGKSTANVANTRLVPGSFIKYLSGFVLAPVEVETYNSQQAYCSNKNMYGFDTIKTTKAEYLVPSTSKNLGSVDCCNQDVRLNQVCQNHKWIDIKKEEVECSVLKACPLSEYSTDPSDPSRKTVQKQVCQENRCVLQTKQVECADSTACREGFTCVQNICKASGAPTGGETVSKDNSEELAQLQAKIFKYVTFGIVFFIAFFVFFFLFRRVPFLANGSGIWINVVLSVITAGLVAMLITWLIVLARSGFLAILGS